MLARRSVRRFRCHCAEGSVTTTPTCPTNTTTTPRMKPGLRCTSSGPSWRSSVPRTLRFFLCSLYTPICLEDYRKPLPPCRSVCERAKAGCAPLMRQYGFPWPDRMRCDLLPVQGDPNTLCMDYNRTAATASPVAPKPTSRPGKPWKNKSSHGSSLCEPECHCRAPLVTVSDRHPLYNRVKTGQIPNCAMPCHNPYLSQEERTFATFWIGVWSVLCFLSTFATIATFLIDIERFKYPERPIIFLSACYMFVSVGYIIRLIAGHERVACTQDHEVDHIHYETTGPALCTLVFLLIYFFGWRAPSGG